MASILSVGTALPRHRYAQGAVKRAYAGIFREDPKLRRYLPIFDRSGVRARHFVKPLRYYSEPRDFSSRNRDYIAEAGRLSELALRRSLKAAGTSPAELGYLAFVTTTGLATPSLDARIAARLGLPAHIKRNPIFGTGCASGAVALARAAEYLAGRPDETAAVVSAELCSLTFQRGDGSVENLVASALFADGAAAVILRGSRRTGGFRVAAWESHLFPDSMDVMGWDFGDGGMKLVLSPEVPRLARERLSPVVLRFLRGQGLGLRDIDHWLLHPGGLRVVEAYEEALGLTPRHTLWSRRCLARRGNLSSASVLFMLEDLLASGRPRPGDHALVMALGPGFAAELLLLRWE